METLSEPHMLPSIQPEPAPFLEVKGSFSDAAAEAYAAGAADAALEDAIYGGALYPNAEDGAVIDQPLESLEFTEDLEGTHLEATAAAREKCMRDAVTFTPPS